MSFDKQLREMIRGEILLAIAPLADAVGELQRSGSVASQLQTLLGQGVKRGRGRPPKASAGIGVPQESGAGQKLKRDRPASAPVACAVIACKRLARSKGYCSAHYQKRRMLERTKRLPSDWSEDAKPQTVRDMVLSRGRAGAKALAASQK